MKKVLILIPLTALLAGCSGFERVGTDAALGAGGGFLASELTHGNPAAAAGGAVGGVALGEGIHALRKRSEQGAYNDGYNRGRADGAKSFYWDQVDRQRNPSTER